MDGLKSCTDGKKSCTDGKKVEPMVRLQKRRYKWNGGSTFVIMTNSLRAQSVFIFTLRLITQLHYMYFINEKNISIHSLISFFL